MLTYITNLKPQNIQTDRLIHWMLSWNTSKTTHRHMQTGPSTAIAITFKTHMLNSNQKYPTRKEAGPHAKTVNNPREDNISTQQSKNVVKTRYGRTVRKPDRLTYE